MLARHRLRVGLPLRLRRRRCVPRGLVGVLPKTSCVPICCTHALPLCLCPRRPGVRRSDEWNCPKDR